MRKNCIFAVGKKQIKLSKKYYTFFIDILHTSCLQELVHELGHAVYDQTVPHGKKMAQRFLPRKRPLFHPVDSPPACIE